MASLLELAMHRQPDDTTCGPTCLHAVYLFHDDELPLEQIVEEVGSLDTGGTLATLLGLHALQRGYAATLYTWDLTTFDPSWFREQGVDIPNRLRARARRLPDPRLHASTRAALDFLAAGGQVRLCDLDGALLAGLLGRSLPVLTGLSATYLYGTQRERPWDDEYDDIHGMPAGHFVVLHGYDEAQGTVQVADPLFRAHRGRGGVTNVPLAKLISAILLGVLTFDGNLLVLEPGRLSQESSWNG